MYAFSTSPDKEEECRKLGANHYVNTSVCVCLSASVCVCVCVCAGEWVVGG